MNRVDLANVIHRRIGGSISHRRIYQAIGIIIEQVANDLICNLAVTVRRFGTFSPHIRRSHMANDVSVGVVRKLCSKRSVKFHPHEAFKSLIRDRQERFIQKNDDHS